MSPNCLVPYFIPNVINRQAVGDCDKLVANADGSLDVYIQAASLDKELEDNWLSGSQRAIHATVAPVLAEERDAERQLDASGGGKSAIASLTMI